MEMSDKKIIPSFVVFVIISSIVMLLLDIVLFAAAAMKVHDSVLYFIVSLIHICLTAGMVLTAFYLYQTMIQYVFQKGIQCQSSYIERLWSLLNSMKSFL